MSFITARKRSLGQGNIFIGVCQEFCSQGGVCLSACWDTPPWEQTPPSPAADTPPEQTHPWSRHPPRSRHPQSRHTPRSRHPPPPWSRHPPPSAEHAGRYGQCAGGTHPTGMQSCYYWSGKISPGPINFQLRALRARTSLGLKIEKTD